MKISRRNAIRGCAALALSPALHGEQPARARPATRELLLNQDWLFSAQSDPAALELDFNDTDYSRITVPHCVTPLSWQNWDPAIWQKLWIYRRHFDLPPGFAGRRLFLEFDHVMAAATPAINGHALAQHLGGFLPFRYEVTQFLKPQGNVLAVTVDSRWINAPPEGSPQGPRSIDYMLPGGITGSVRLRAVPNVFVSDVFAKPVSVLDSGRRLDVICTIDAGAIPSAALRIEVALRDRSRVIARSSSPLKVEAPGSSQVTLTLSRLDHIELWDLNSPRLYDVVVMLSSSNLPVYEYRTRTGFRDARFELNGFFLNGRRVQLFGLNRHELYPYVGRAMPDRVMRRDAEILRREFNCNAVRCSHYPQSKAFLDACDELGLLVWEEIPGWQYIGDESWQELALRDVNGMVRRDRNHPSIVIWGVRINESHNDPALYERTKAAAKSLDDSRPTSGSMVYDSTKDWVQDVFAYDVYRSAADGSVGLIPPVPGVPFFFSEAVGQYSYGGHGFNNKYRRAGDVTMQQKQAIYHAQIHDRAAADPRYAGVIAWCGFEYGSLMNAYAGVKYPGVADVFRVPKLGASFYRSQVDPKQRPVIEPNFYWDFGPAQPSGPGNGVAVFSNLERLELLVDGQLHSVLKPDRINYPHLKHPPFFADLTLDGANKPELRIDGYIGEHLVLSRSFSADPSLDQFMLQADDPSIVGDGSDATRLVFGVVDKFGAPRLFGGGSVTFSLDGPGILVGDNPSQLAESGGVAAVWIKAKPRSQGRIRVSAEHGSLGKKFVDIAISVQAHWSAYGDG